MSRVESLAYEDDAWAAALPEWSALPEAQEAAATILRASQHGQLGLSRQGGEIEDARLKRVGEGGYGVYFCQPLGCHSSCIDDPAKAA